MGIVSVVKKILNRAVCGEESSVMFIEGVPPLPCGIACAVRRLRKKSQTKSSAIQMKSIFTARRRALLCCQAIASQGGTRHRNRIVFF